MKKFANGVELSAGFVKAYRVGNNNCYCVQGYCIMRIINDTKCYVLQPADLRKSPVAVFPIEEISRIEVMF